MAEKYYRNPKHREPIHPQPEPESNANEDLPSDVEPKEEEKDGT